MNVFFLRIVFQLLRFKTSLRSSWNIIYSIFLLRNISTMFQKKTCVPKNTSKLKKIHVLRIVERKMNNFFFFFLWIYIIVYLNYDAHISTFYTCKTSSNLRACDSFYFIIFWSERILKKKTNKHILKLLEKNL